VTTTSSSGDGLVGKVEVNFLGGPMPAGRILPPSRELAAEKGEFSATRRHLWFGLDPHAVDLAAATG
jgi:hypothetical protein